MIHAIFNIGKVSYGIRASLITEIVPMVEITGIPTSNRAVAGIMNYHGRHVPVIDLCMLLAEKPCQQLESSRIVLTTVDGTDGSSHPVALLTERLYRTASLSDSNREDTPYSDPDKPWITGIFMHHDTSIYTVDIGKMIPGDILQSMTGKQSEAVS